MSRRRASRHLRFGAAASPEDNEVDAPPLANLSRARRVGRAPEMPPVLCLLGRDFGDPGRQDGTDGEADLHDDLRTRQPGCHRHTGVPSHAWLVYVGSTVGWVTFGRIRPTVLAWTVGAAT